MLQKFYGSIEGTLVSITVEGGQALGINSSLEGKTIRCYFEESLLEVAKNSLGCRVRAFGRIYQQDGEKVSIHVDEIKDLRSQVKLPTLDEILTRLSSLS